MFKQIAFIGAFLFSVVTFSNLSAQECCQPATPCDQPVGDCYCKYVRYRPVCTYTQRCVEECIPYTRTCCRQVPEYYNVQKCKYRCEKYCVPQQRCQYVPEYYCVPVTKCRYVPEYYTVDVKKCRYVPQYYCVNIEKCRSVPEYYCEPRCRYRTEQYCVQEYKTCKKYVCEPNYSYCPEYYWKHECQPTCAPCCN